MNNIFDVEFVWRFRNNHWVAPSKFHTHIFSGGFGSSWYQCHDVHMTGNQAPYFLKLWKCFQTSCAKVQNTWLLQSDWLCQDPGRVHKKLFIVTRTSVSRISRLPALLPPTMPPQSDGKESLVSETMILFILFVFVIQELIRNYASVHMRWRHMVLCLCICVSLCVSVCLNSDFSKVAKNHALVNAV